ncbi:MAG: phosphatidylserine decarboxylase [Bacteroidales bacterium]|nr:phosphatidylserine decarboxylase [Candidatus Cryptobacteroides caccocaballi]
MKKVKIHQDGRGTIAVVWFIALSLIVISVTMINPRFIWLPIVILMGFMMAWILFFFRVPVRGNIYGKNVVTSVADGQVVIVEKVYEPEYFKCEVMQVSVYMSFFNVHVNYWPIDGENTYYKYHPGKYFLAWMPKASELNEHASLAVRNECGEVFFKQMAGTFARRIVTYDCIGEQVEKATQCGIIKFGSRIDMYLPLTAKINVEVGDEVRACESVIAKL